MESLPPDSLHLVKSFYRANRLFLLSNPIRMLRACLELTDVKSLEANDQFCDRFILTLKLPRFL